MVTSASVETVVNGKRQLKLLNNGENYVIGPSKSCDKISPGAWCSLDEAFNTPEPVDQLLSGYAKRFHEIKTPRKLLWKKNLGTVKMFCVAYPRYDKSLQQLQSFLSGLIAEEKLELRDGMYLLKK
ncbi:hypothetical protein U1Q18_015028 [Sarracenia purpurea var. burkii]